MLEPDPAILQSAEKLFRAKGYESVLLAEVASDAAIALPAVLVHYPDKQALLHALLAKYDPSSDIKIVFKQFQGGTPQAMIQHVVAALLQAFDLHSPFAYFALMDTQVNEGRYLNALIQDLASDAAAFITRLATMPGVRPISTIILGRALAAYCIGFVSTQLLAPDPVKRSLRAFPPRIWVEEMTHIILYGIIEPPTDS